VHFERMSDVDLHPRSLPVSRLSPAKSNGGLGDHLAQHQHGKGDSAYSSFSGGSTAPDYPSPFLPDDLQPASFGHDADLKYVKSICHPTQALQADSRPADRLYRSVEAITQRYRDDTGTEVDRLDGLHGNDKALSKKEGRLGADPPVRPPPVPARLDSFTATRNLENGRVHHQGTEVQPKAAGLQPQPRGPIPHKAEPADPDTDPVYSVWRGSQQPPSYRLHLQARDHAAAPLTPESLSIAGEQQKPSNVLDRSPPGGAGQPERPRLRRPSSGGGCNGDHPDGGHFESQRKRAHSARDRLGSEPTPRSAGPSLINGSIRHKGQFYFVTGVCSPSASLCGGESAAAETHRLRERRHSAMDQPSGPLWESSRSPGGAMPDERETFASQSDLSFGDQENRRLSYVSTRSSRSFDALEEIDAAQNRDIGRHTANNHIFYCGPDGSRPPQEVGSPHGGRKREEPAKRGKRPPLGDVASERINKETTPLLYQLTGASRAAALLKKDADFSMKGNDGVPNRRGREDEERAAQSGGALDDSFTKYYKEQLQDAQSKVLRETSYKRRDLQLSWPHRVRQKPESRPAAIHIFSPSLDSATSTDTLATSVTSGETERGSVRGEVRERQEEKEKEKDAGRPANVAQPQVARVGGRRRLTQEQKTMYFSEPEKLHQLGAAPPVRSACRSFGNESEAEERWPEGERGLVAARRKMFETRGRALSASGPAKSNLKHVQHKALVEYMERKTGHKAAEASPPRQRHSLGEKPFDWVPRTHDGKHAKKKLPRPHSAGRILDSSSSSMRYRREAERLCVCVCVCACACACVSLSVCLCGFFFVVVQIK